MNQFRPEPDAHPVIALYAQIAEQAARLLRSAQQSQWDEFALQEQQFSQLVQSLNNYPEDPQTLTESEILLRTVYLRQIMNDNDQTHQLVKLRTDELERALVLQNNADRLEKGYGE
ncbi:flagellar protein FliT [Limnobacter humi]|uniref:Flagellar protein FliT n=1 Tax=Limnobacter humi TaxID=1778671 RepID=A0ABT1WJ10_9BURK|nr:flagellar protein FliT [Limnobacter humi]MCQ8897512.1 flagellar protein FliT [Limnobacter humi]